MGIALTALIGMAAFALVGARRRAPGPAEAAAGAPLGAASAPVRWPRRRRSESASMIAVLANVVELLRSGLAPGLAWREAAGLPTELGSPERAALQRLVAGGPADARAAEARAADAIIAATRLSAEVGAPLVDVLDRLRVALEAADELACERAAALAGPRASARILAWLPVAGLVLGAAIGADPVTVFADGGVGSAVLVAGLGCHLAGRVFTGRLVRIAECAGDDP